MKKILLIAGFILSQSVISQNLNVILQVNGEVLMRSSIANLYIGLHDNENSKNYNLNYYPGDLIVQEELFRKIKTESKFYLHFDYYTYERGNQQIANFDIELNAKLLEQPYLIINIYDFRNRVYRKRYSCLTDRNYLVEITFPNSGLWVHCK